MSSTPAILKGVIHGKTVELEREPGLPDGQSVNVTLEPLESGRLPPGEGIRRSAGAWGDDPQGLDEFLEWNRQQRKVGRQGISE